MNTDFYDLMNSGIGVVPPLDIRGIGSTAERNFSRWLRPAGVMRLW
jgi:hypothetical protein